MPLIYPSRLPRIVPVILLIGWSLCILWLSLVPHPEKVIGIKVWDKLSHAAAYALLASLAAQVGLRYFPSRHTAWRWAVAASWLFGLLMELGQGLLTRSRRASLGDILANSVGIFAVYLVGALLARRRQRPLTEENS
ncbi:MAG: hypothetical protein A2091_03800 [Desulfuromonadales bacterium GWD2_61_12]|nr:MAG: hypothetical protein A2005_09085 [Desulfuromonadales bacterium GWC2_61_20]OGR36126.1 MAG: hypothetical protein A2091_03800 [Desulfuromonadales bacterium GWD2_61_12]